MQGLEVQESEQFIRFFKVVQEKAEKQGCVFFLDTGEGRDFVDDKWDIEDLSGWLIPKSEVIKFEPEWKDGTIASKWYEYYLFAIWSKIGEHVTIEFKNF